MGDLSVYLHIPFCTSRCQYCAFYFETGWSPRVLEATLDATLEELALRYRALGNPRVRTVYLGGGTPSVIPPERLGSFLSDALDIIGAGRRGAVFELEFEGNPESTSAELLSALSDGCGGRNRVQSLRYSLGVQSLDGRTLKTLGRRGTAEQSLRAMSLLDEFRRNADRRFRINFDLIYGAPGQSGETIAADIDGLLAFRPDGVSLYQLSVEEGTPLQRRIASGALPAPDAGAQDELWDAARARLESGGYRNYEVSNFALPGGESKHNFAYWMLRPYLGVGPGAVSTVADPDGPGGIIRLTNPDLFAYGRMDRSLPGGSEVETIGARDLFIEIFITGLRTVAGVSLSRLGKRFGGAGLAAGEELRRRWAGRTLPRPGRIILDDANRYAMDRLMPDVAETAEAYPLAAEFVPWPASPASSV
jgi:oxygen-independent coproporphyrinogen-3 oxidase